MSSLPFLLSLTRVSMKAHGNVTDAEVDARVYLSTFVLVLFTQRQMLVSIRILNGGVYERFNNETHLTQRQTRDRSIDRSSESRCALSERWIHKFLLSLSLSLFLSDRIANAFTEWKHECHCARGKRKFLAESSKFLRKYELTRYPGWGFTRALLKLTRFLVRSYLSRNFAYPTKRFFERRTPIVVLK